MSLNAYTNSSHLDDPDIGLYDGLSDEEEAAPASGRIATS